MQQAGQVPYLDQNDAHEQSLGQSDGSLPGPEQTLYQSINQSINQSIKTGLLGSGTFDQTTTDEMAARDWTCPQLKKGCWKPITLVEHCSCI